jgi:hypothetical protein
MPTDVTEKQTTFKQLIPSITNSPYKKEANLQRIDEDKLV